MANFGDFTDGGTPDVTGDYMVGYASGGGAGSDRRWKIGYFGALTNAANDGAAATAGVAIGQIYRNGSVLMVRVS